MNFNIVSERYSRRRASAFCAALGTIFPCFFLLRLFNRRGRPCLRQSAKIGKGCERLKGSGDHTDVLLIFPRYATYYTFYCFTTFAINILVDGKQFGIEFSNRVS